MVQRATSRVAVPGSARPERLESHSTSTTQLGGREMAALVSIGRIWRSACAPTASYRWHTEAQDIRTRGEVCEAAHPLCNWLGERFRPQVSATRVRIPKLATGVRHAAARATAILIPPASIAIVFRPAPVGSRSRTIAAYRPGRSRSYRILDNRNRSKPS